MHLHRFNIGKLQEIMPYDTRYITIIRSPVDNVESVFGFFQVNVSKPNRFFRAYCAMHDPYTQWSIIPYRFVQDQMPFIDWLESANSDTAARLNTFYDNPSRYYNTDTDWYFRAKNHMFFDIG